LILEIISLYVLYFSEIVYAIGCFQNFKIFLILKAVGGLGNFVWIKQLFKNDFELSRFTQNIKQTPPQTGTVNV
jgi:hypothetical protein